MRRRRPKPSRLTHISSSPLLHALFHIRRAPKTYSNTHTSILTGKSRNNHLNKPKHRGVAESAGGRAWPHKHCCTPANHAAFLPFFLYTGSLRHAKTHKATPKYHCFHAMATSIWVESMEHRVILILMWHHCVRVGCHVFYALRRTGHGKICLNLLV